MLEIQSLTNPRETGVGASHHWLTKARFSCAAQVSPPPMACRVRPGVEADGPATEPKSKANKKTDAGLPTWDGRPRKHDPASEVARAVHHEAVVRRRLAKLQRAVSKHTMQLSKTETVQRNRAVVNAVKEDLDKRSGRDIRRRLAEVVPASEAELLELSALFNETLAMFPDPNAREWFRLFKHLDDDGTGRISYVEFAGMIREELRLNKRDLPEPRLQSLWRALDKAHGRRRHGSHVVQGARRHDTRGAEVVA